MHCRRWLLNEVLSGTYGPVLLFCLCLGTALSPAQQYRRAIFLHHSVGLCLWDRSRVSSLTPPTTMPLEIAAYNARHGYTGASAVSMDELYGPEPSSVNYIYWWRWAEIFEGTDSYGYSLDQFYASYPVIVVKTGFGTTQYTTSVDSIEAQKGEWRSILSVMKNHQANFFSIWTGYPAATDGHSARAALTNQFVRWATDTLAPGKDSFGPLPPNVTVFDAFHVLASPVDGYCDSIYGSWNEGPMGDHPSNAAVAVFDPVFVGALFDAAIAYEQGPLGVTWAGVPSITSLPGGHILVRWETLSELNTFRFYVERKGVAWQTIDSVNGAGTVLTRREYAVWDSGAAAGSWTYRVREVDLNGSVRYSQAASTIAVPGFTFSAFALEQNFPNPFNPETTLRYTLPLTSRVSLVVFNVLGETVATLVNGEEEAGTHEVRFTPAGLSSGIYYYRLSAGNFLKTKSLTILK
jgi:hypothetical protein